MDSGVLFLEGVIPGGTKNEFKIPCKLLCFAKEGHQKVVMARLRGERLCVSGDYDAESMFEVSPCSRSSSLGHVATASPIDACHHGAPAFMNTRMLQVCTGNQKMVPG